MIAQVIEIPPAKQGPSYPRINTAAANDLTTEGQGISSHSIDSGPLEYSRTDELQQGLAIKKQISSIKDWQPFIQTANQHVNIG